MFCSLGSFQYVAIMKWTIAIKVMFEILGEEMESIYVQGIESPVHFNKLRG